MSMEIPIVNPDRRRNAYIVILSTVLFALLCNGAITNDQDATRIRSEQDIPLWRQLIPEFKNVPSEDVTSQELGSDRSNVSGAGESCVAINTPIYGNDETVNPSLPIIHTPGDAIAELGVDAHTGVVYVKQGDEVKPFNPADVFANGSQFCVGK